MELKKSNSTMQPLYDLFITCGELSGISPKTNQPYNFICYYLDIDIEGYCKRIYFNIKEEDKPLLEIYRAIALAKKNRKEN